MSQPSFDQVHGGTVQLHALAYQTLVHAYVAAGSSTAGSWLVQVYIAAIGSHAAAVAARGTQIDTMAE